MEYDHVSVYVMCWNDFCQWLAFPQPQVKVYSGIIPCDFDLTWAAS